MLKRGFQFAPGYRLQEFLGRGQFGQVWRATAPGGTMTAAKFIDLSDGQGQKEYDGVRRVKQIRHANLMPITAIWLLDAQGKVIEEAPDEAVETIDLSVVEPRGQSAVYRPEVEPSWLVVTMLLGGKSLQQRLRECVEEGLPGIPPKELISYMDESAKGIDFLNTPQHDLGEGPIAIQHSDVKPANIVLIGNSAVVCDFGLARILTRNQVTATSAAGTPAYMAPEAISGKPCRTSDQYSLAVTYYHLRTGALPVNDGSLWEVLDAHRHGNLKLGLVPEAEQEVLRKATDLDWKQRFESNVDMVDALREALRSEGHTKPSFVPKSVNLQPDVAGGVTVDVGGDPTETLDLPVEESAGPAESMLETSPFVQAEQSTQGGFLKKTLPELDEQPVASKQADESFVDQVKRNPKLIAGLAAAGLVLILGVSLWPSSDAGGDDAATIGDATLAGGETVGGGGSDPAEVNVDPQPPIVDGDPKSLVTDAIALLDTDQSAAIKKFDAALQLDPALTVPMVERAGHNNAVMWMLESPNGAELVSIADGKVPFLWDLGDTGAGPTPLLGHDDLVVVSAMRRGGVHLLTGDFGGNARIWNLEADDVADSAYVLEEHEAGIEAAVWHPTEPVAVTAADDGNLVTWTMQSANAEYPDGRILARKIPIEYLMRSLASDPDGKWLVGQTVGKDFSEPDDDLLAFSWDAVLKSEGSPPITKLGLSKAKKNAISFFGAGTKKFLAVGEVGGTIAIYEVDDNEFRFNSRNPKAHSMDVDAMRVVAVDDRSVIVTGAGDGTVHWWLYGDSSSDTERRELDSFAAVSCVDVSPDGRWVAAGLNNGSVWLWDTTEKDKNKGMYEVSSHSESVDSIVIDVQSKWLIGGCGDGTVRMWDLPTLKLLALTRPTAPLKEVESMTLESQSLSMR